MTGSRANVARRVEVRRVYTRSPETSYAAPTRIRRSDFVLRVWGDDVAGRVFDWVHVANETIHQLVFVLPAGGTFKHSDDYRTIFAADVVYHVLSGTIAVADPETGEVQRLEPGETLLIRRDTWHHGFNCGMEPAHVIECIAPAPRQGTTRAYSSQLENLLEARYAQNGLLERWPAARDEARKAERMALVRYDDVLWRIEGNGGAIVAILASTENATFARVEVLPGRSGGTHAHAGEETGYVLGGHLNIRCEAEDGADETLLEVDSGEAFYLPEGLRHEYLNWGGESAVFFAQVAPTYTP
jgi:mannose-6-phosphate isomerase-like protein (cupin superfamily)